MVNAAEEDNSPEEDCCTHRAPQSLLPSKLFFAPRVLTMACFARAMR